MGTIKAKELRYAVAGLGGDAQHVLKKPFTPDDHRELARLGV